jgi:hypothetical protein
MYAQATKGGGRGPPIGIGIGIPEIGIPAHQDFIVGIGTLIY